MGCVFHAINSELSFKNIVHEIGLKTYRLFDKDEKTKEYKNNNYCFSCIVSEADWDDTYRQFEDMKTFINDNKSKLGIIKDKITNVDWRFDVPINSRLNKNIIVQCDYIDSELIRLCAEFNIGIALSYYSTNKDKI